MNLLSAIKSNNATVFRKLYMKRRELTGEYETNWQEIPQKYIRSFGQITYSIDNVVPNFFVSSGITLNLYNDYGYFSDMTDEDKSFFYKKLGIYKTLVRIDAGYYDENYNTYPSTPTLFIGYVYEGIKYSEDGTLSIEVNPLINIFDEFPSEKISGIGSVQTAKSVIEKIRDHTDDNGVAIFQKFVSLSAWYLTSTTYEYNISTSTSLQSRTCWQLMKDLAAAENNVTYIDFSGNFYFVERNRETTTSDWHFSGYDDNDKSYGHNIIGAIQKSKSYESIYNRIRIKYDSKDTISSYYIVEENWNWGDSSSSFQYGVKEFLYENELVSESYAQEIGEYIFDEFSFPKDTISFNTKFIPHLMVNNICTLSYNPNREYTGSAVWGTFSYNSALWGDRKGKSFGINSKNYRIINIAHNLDSMYSNFTVRETDIGIQGIQANKYRVTGDLTTTGISLDINNSGSGTALYEWDLLGSFKYGAEKYGPTAVYESKEYSSITEYSSIRFVGVGDANDIEFQWRKNEGYGWEPWSTLLNAINTVTVSLTGKRVQFRWVFHSSAWSDTDNFKVTVLS